MCVCVCVCVCMCVCVCVCDLETSRIRWPRPELARRMRWAVHVARMGEDRGVYRVLVGKPEKRRPLRRPRRR